MDKVSEAIQAKMEIKRLRIIQWLINNDANGCFSDEDCYLENIPRFTYDQAVKLQKQLIRGN
jgi:hypothetical protein